MFGLKDRIRSVSSGLATGISPVAIDFGASGVKVLQLSSAASTPNLVTAGFLATPENLCADPGKRLAWQIENLPAFVRQLGFKGKKAVCTIPTAQSYCKHIQIAAGAPREVSRAVAETMAAQLGCDPAALLCRHIEAGPAASGAGMIEVIAIACARAMVERLMACIRACKLEPAGMQPDALAILRSFDHISRRAEDIDTTSLYLDLGMGHTRLLIAHGTQLVFAKPIGVGGLALDALVAKQLKVDIESARRERLACGNLAGEPAPAPVAPPPPPTNEKSPSGKEDGDGMAILRAAMAAGASRAGGMGGPKETETGAPARSDTTATAEDRRAGNLPAGHNAIRAGAFTVSRPTIDLSEPLDSLTEELMMCLRYHDALFPGRKLSRTIFVGGEARHTALCRHIARVIKAPASVADPMARVARTGSEPMQAVNFDQPQPGWAAAVGLCLGPTDL